MKKNILISFTLLTTINCFSQAPNFAWAKSIGGVSNDVAYSTFIDAFGNVYTSGGFQGTVDFDPGSGIFNLTSLGSNDIFISKLDRTGNFLWAKSIGGTGNDYGNAITLDAMGNIYITGGFSATVDFDPGLGIYNLSSAGNYDIFISKLDNLGNFIWAKRIGAENVDMGNSIAVDIFGNVYTTGYFIHTVDFDPGSGIYNFTSLINPAYGTYWKDIFISKLDSLGNFVWAKKMGGGGDDYGRSIAVDSFENVYSTGTFQQLGDFDPGPATYNLSNSAGNNGSYISKLDSLGNFVWAKEFGLTWNWAQGYSLKLDAFGNVYTTGFFSGNNQDFDPGPGIYYMSSASYSNDIYISKLNNQGNFVWAKQMRGSGDDYGLSLTVDTSGNVYTTGEFQGTVDFDPSAGTFNLSSAGGYDIFISKLNSSGNFVWAKSIGGASTNDYGFSIAVNDSGNVVLAGYFGDPTIAFYPDTLTNAGGNTGTNDIFIAKLMNCSPPSQPSIINGNIIICDSSSNIYTIASVNAASSYTWSIPSGWSASSSTDTIINITSDSNSGSILVTASNTCSISIPQTLPITVISKPMVSVNSPIICSGQTATLTANGATSYVWSAGATVTGLNSAEVSPVVTNTYIVIGANLCGTDSSFATVTVNATYIQNISASICQGNIYTFPDNTTAITDTIYISHFSTINSCDSSIVTILTVNSLPTVTIDLSTVDTLCQSTGVLNLTGESPVGGIYSGIGVIGNTFNSDTAGLGSQIITYTYTDGNNCTNTATGNIYVDVCTEINETTNDNLFSIFPNPTSGQFEISLQTDNAEIRVTNILGQQLLKTQTTKKTTNLQLDDNGVYIVYVTTKQGTTTRKLVVNR